MNFIKSIFSAEEPQDRFEQDAQQQPLPICPMCHREKNGVCVKIQCEECHGTGKLTTTYNNMCDWCNGLGVWYQNQIRCKTCEYYK